MNAIVIVDKNWGIGRDNNLLVHLPSDLKYFKEKTTGKVIVIGRKTLESCREIGRASVGKECRSRWSPYH